MAGHNETLARFYTFFGGGKPEPEKPKVSAQPMTPKLFVALFGGRKK